MLDLNQFNRNRKCSCGTHLGDSQVFTLAEVLNDGASVSTAHPFFIECEGCGWLYPAKQLTNA